MLTNTQIENYLPIHEDYTRNGVVCSQPFYVVNQGIYVPCGKHNATCQYCSKLYLGDIKQIFYDGFSDDTRNYFLVTLTAPSFGKVDDRGLPINVEKYKYGDAVDWNFNA